MVEADAIKNRDVVYQQLSHALPSSANIAAEVHACCQPRLMSACLFLHGVA